MDNEDAMIEATPLPQYLVQRYHGWRATAFVENRAWYRRLAEDGGRLDHSERITS